VGLMDDIRKTLGGSWTPEAPPAVEAPPAPRVVVEEPQPPLPRRSSSQWGRQSINRPAEPLPPRPALRPPEEYKDIQAECEHKWQIKDGVKSCWLCHQKWLGDDITPKKGKNWRAAVYGGKK
jgi:hypothetical protein